MPTRSAFLFIWLSFCNYIAQNLKQLYTTRRVVYFGLVWKSISGVDSPTSFFAKVTLPSGLCDSFIMRV